MALRFGSLAIEAVCGPLVGGAFWAQAVAAELDVEFYHTEQVATSDGGGLYSVNYRLPATLPPRLAKLQIADFRLQIEPELAICNLKSACNFAGQVLVGHARQVLR